MARTRPIAAPKRPPSPTDPTDAFLLASLRGGDEAALRKLMDRHDRLVRYTIFRTAGPQATADPDWLESVASSVWTGFVQSVRTRPDQDIASISAYLARVARNQAISAIRRGVAARSPTPTDLSGNASELEATLEEPIESLERLELLSALRECLNDLEPDDRTLASQLAAICDRRWQDAAAALGISESTLRSRWKRTLDRLRVCLQRKTGSVLAPGPGGGDV